MRIKAHTLRLKGSWTKGGKPRIIPITTPEQRRCLDQAKQRCPKHSLIPKGTAYITQRRYYDRTLQRLGVGNGHGFRYAYAQRRYAQLTQALSPDQKGWRCPLQGGPTRGQLTAQQQIIDRHARAIISLELGHARIRISGIYIG